MKPETPTKGELVAELERLRQQVAALTAGTRALLAVTEHGSNSGRVFQARVAAYSGLRWEKNHPRPGVPFVLCHQCGHQYQEALGRYGCPNCHGEGLEE